MPEIEQSPSSTIEALDFSKVVRLTSDQVAIERACRLIDTYIAEKWQPQTSTPPDRPEAA